MGVQEVPHWRQEPSILWSALSHSRSVFVISRDNVQELINKAENRLPEGKFCIESTRSEMSIYGQMTGILINNRIAKIILIQKSTKP